MSYARSKNLTPYDVLKIASMVEREASVPSERPLVAAVIYNRLHNHMQLGIDATLRYGLHIPPTKSITKSELASSNPYNTRRFFGLPPTPIANPGLASLEAAAHPAKVDYLYYVRKPDHEHHFFTASASAFDAYLAAHGYPLTTHVGLLGHPVAHSLSPRMQNAAFDAAGLDWRYAAFDVEDPVAAVAALRTLGFVGANVTIPHKPAVVAACDEADGDAVNTLVFRDGRVLGFNTDKEILAGIHATRACLIGAGAPRRRWRPPCRPTRASTPAGATGRRTRPAAT